MSVRTDWSIDRSTDLIVIEINSFRCVTRSICCFSNSHWFVQRFLEQRIQLKCGCMLWVQQYIKQDRYFPSKLFRKCSHRLKFAFSSLLRLCASYLDRSKVFEHIVIAQNNKKIYLRPSNAIEKCQRLRMTRLGLKESRRETGAGTSFFLLLLSQCSCYFQFFFFSFSASAPASASSVVIHH